MAAAPRDHEEEGRGVQLAAVKLNPALRVPCMCTILKRHGPTWHAAWRVFVMNVGMPCLGEHGLVVRPAS